MKLSTFTLLPIAAALADITTTSISQTNIHQAIDKWSKNGNDNEYGPILNWNVTNVTNMSGVFFDYYGEKFRKFNEDLSQWDVSNVTNMNYMFYQTEEFNSDLSEWDVGKVTDMGGMFYKAEAFNTDISSWDTSNVVDMFNMFYGSSAFNQNLSDWDISKVTDMTGAFQDTTNFRQELCWDFSNVEASDDIFRNSYGQIGCTITTEAPSVSLTITPTNVPTVTPTATPSSLVMETPSVAPIVTPKQEEPGNSNKRIDPDSAASVTIGSMKVMGMIASMWLGWTFVG